MGLEQPSYLIQKVAPIVMRELQPYIYAKVGPLLAEKVGMPLAKNVGLPLAKKIGIPLARKSGTVLLNRVAYPMINKMLFKAPSQKSSPQTPSVQTPPSPTLPSAPLLTEPDQTANKKGLFSLINPRANKSEVKDKNKKHKTKKKSKAIYKSSPSGSSGLFGRRKRSSLLNYSNDIPGPVDQPSQSPIFLPAQNQSEPTVLNESEFNPYENPSPQSSLFGRKRYGFDFN